MKRVSIFVIIFVVAAVAMSTVGFSKYNRNLIEKIRLSHRDIPAGFMYGRVPRIYRKVLKGNPWMMDRGAIKRLASKIYPGGNYHNISQIYMSIFADRRTPFGDDIVCYIIQFNGISATEKELKKINTFSGYNNDRTILISHDGLAVFLIVDETRNYQYIQKIAENIGKKLKSL